MPVVDSLYANNFHLTQFQSKRQQDTEVLRQQQQQQQLQSSSGGKEKSSKSSKNKIKKPKVFRFEHSDFAKCLAEATGTYFLVLTVGCNVMVMSTGGALSIGAMLMSMIFAMGSVSGAHFNPAVSLAVFLSGRHVMDIKQLFFYVCSQLVGAIIAGLTYFIIFGDAFALKPVAQYTVPMVMAVESIYTFALCYVVLNVATTALQAGNHYFGLAIGFTVVSGAIAIGGISNACLNPAVAIGSLFAAFVAQGHAALEYIVIYFFTPFIGSICAVILFYLARRHDEYSQGGVFRVIEPKTKAQKAAQAIASINTGGSTKGSNAGPATSSAATSSSSCSASDPIRIAIGDDEDDTTSHDAKKVASGTAPLLAAGGSANKPSVVGNLISDEI